MKLLFLFISLFLLISLAGLGQNPMVPQRILHGKFVKSWLLLGPVPLKLQKDPALSYEHLPGYETDYLKSQGGEGNLTIQTGDAIEVGKKNLKWKSVQATDSIVDLVAQLSNIFPALAYACTEVEAADEGVQLLGIGSNDGATMFVNGQKVFDHPGARPVKVDGDLVPVLLKKGKNQILLKIEQHGNKWGFCLRFHPFSATEALDRGDLFKVQADENGVASVVSAYPTEILNSLVQGVTISVADVSGIELVKEQRMENFCAMLKNLVATYQPYSATLTVQLKSGQVIQSKGSFTAGKRID